ncbi:HAAS signaling domain-containing protein [Streptomyces sp. NPDC004267]|uniref:HAAS signaling domain-containing protein n=1 Tax=Streptomyces sp. NPDC004267 TaxID=3364694 RepID=UPI0036CE6AF6
MNTIDHPLATAYLDAVARETAELPAERRAELLADLREHIEVSGAEGEQQLREVLADLGEPRTVAASALAEEPVAPAATTAEPPRTGRAWPAVLPLTAAGPLFLFNMPLGGAVLLIGLWLLWNSPLWDQPSKTIGTATAAAPPVAVLFGSLLLAAPRIGPTELLLLLAFTLAVPAIGAVTLLRAARR